VDRFFWATVYSLAQHNFLSIIPGCHSSSSDGMFAVRDRCISLTTPTSVYMPW